MERKMHVVKWDTVCSNKRTGGLVIRSLSLVNKALLGKMVWKFATECNPTRKEVIKIKDKMEEGGWFA